MPRSVRTSLDRLRCIDLAIVLFAGLSVTVFTGGCAHRRTAMSPSCQANSNCPEVAFQSLRLVRIGERSIPRVWSFPQVTALPIVDESTTHIRALTADECERLAAQSSKAANQLVAEQNISPSDGGTPDLATLLDLQAAQQRNLSAGLALEAYYQLLGVYLAHGIVQESLQKLADSQATIEAMSEDVPSGDSLAVLQRERLELLSKIAELRYQQQALTSQLEFYLVLESDSQHPIWTDQVNLTAIQLPTLEETLECAYQRRSDLAAARTLANSSDPALLAAAKQGLLASGSGGWSQLSIPKPLLLCAAKWQRQLAALELSARHEQLCQLVNDLELAIRLEVTEAWEATQQQLTTLEIKQKILASSEQSIQTQQQSNQLVPTSPADEMAIQRERLAARRDVLQSTIAAQLAWVRLQKAQGLLGNAH